MKTRFVAFAAIATAMCLASCNNDETSIPDTTPQGERTSMEFTIKTPRAPQTYTVTDPSATEAEMTMKTVNVLIYAKGTNGGYTLESNTPRGIADFTRVGTTDTYRLNANRKIATTTGDKKIVLAMNYTSDLPAVGDPESELYTLVREGMVANELCDPAGDGFAMFSTQVTSKSLVADADQNNVILTVRRLVAKMAVFEGAELRNGSGDIESEGGILSDPEFAVGHVNTSIYPFQKLAGSPLMVQDFNWDTWEASDFINIASYDLGSEDYLPLNVIGTDVDNLNAVYAPENTAQTYETDGSNVTYLSVRAQYTPPFYANADGSVKSVPTEPGTFYTVVTSDGSVMYFVKPDDADGYVTLHPGSVKTPEPYQDGLCYYRVYINPTGKASVTAEETVANPYDVLRNNYYKATIKRIKAPGSPTDDADITETTDITFDVEPDPWEPVDDEYEL